MTIYNIDNPLGDDGRNKLNHNFQQIKNDFDNVVETVSDKAFEKVVDNAKLNWKEPVQTSNDLPSNASEGDTRMTRDTGKVFRFNGSAWVEIQQIDAGPVNELDTRVTSQLAQNTSFQEKNQTDFIQVLNGYKQSKPILYKILQDRRIDVFIPQYGNLGAIYRFLKINDDFVRTGFGDFTEIGLVDTYAENKNYTSTTGVWATNSPPNNFTREVGGTFTIDFYGAGIDLVHYADASGGIYEVAIDGEVVKTISTHINGVPANELIDNKYGKREIARGLELKNHKLIATFKGDDPNNPPSGGAGTSRGWIRYATEGLMQDYNYTSHIYRPSYQETNKIKNILVEGSVKEFAFSINDSLGNTEWIPEHNAKPAMRALSQDIIINGVPITDYAQMKEFKEADTIIIKQKLIGYHPNEPQIDVCEVTINHTINSEGVRNFVKVEWLKDTFVNVGYGMMLPVINTSTNMLITSNLEPVTLNATGETDIPNGEKCLSFMFTSNDGYVAIMKVFNTEKSYRDIENANLYVQHRTDLQKLYTQVYNKQTVQAGEIYTFTCHYAIGKIEQAIDLFS